MTALKYAVLVSLSLVIAACGDSGSKNNASERVFVKGNPLEILAGSSYSSRALLSEDDLLDLDKMELQRVQFFAEADEIKKSKRSSPIGLNQGHIHTEDCNHALLGDSTSDELLDGQTPPGYVDLSEIPKRPFFSKISGSKLKYQAEDRGMSLIFHREGDKYNLRDWQLRTDQGRKTLNISPIHLSWKDDRSALTVLAVIEGFFFQDGRYDPNQKRKNLVYMVFTDKDPAETGPSDLANDNNYYLFGKGTRVRWPLQTEVKISLCGSASDQSLLDHPSALSQWNDALGSQLTLRLEKKDRYPPFSDLNHNCVYVVENYKVIRGDISQGFRPADALTIPNLRSKKIIDGDIFFYRAEFEKNEIDLYDYRFEPYIKQTFLHELGHILGLHHNFDGTQSVMSYENDITFQLYDYDKKAIRKLYDVID